MCVWVNQFAEVTLLADSPGSPHMTGLDQQARVPAISQTEGTSTRTRRPNRRHYLNIVTQNLRGLKTEERVAEMCHAMGSRNIFAACVQETWRTGREQLEHCQTTLLLSGLGSGDGRGNRGSQGVGIGLGADATVAWRATGSEVHDDLGAPVIAARMMVRDSQKRDVGIFLVSAYGPIGAATEEAWDEFLTTLTICCSRKRREDILVIGSDINSSLGTDSSAASRTPTSMRKSLGRHGVAHVNEAGRRFRAFLENNGLLALSTFFRKRSYGTWELPRSRKMHQLDHILVEGDGYCRFSDCGVSDNLLDSDHRAVRCKLRCIRRLKKKAEPRQLIQRYDLARLDDKRLAKSMCDKVCAKCEANWDEQQPSYKQLASAVQEAVAETLPMKERPQPGWFSAAASTLQPLIDERNAAFAACLGRRTRARTERLRRARKVETDKDRSGKGQRPLGRGDLRAVPTRECAWLWHEKILGGCLTSKERSAEDNARHQAHDDQARWHEMHLAGGERAVFRDHFAKLFGRQPTGSPSVVQRLPQRPELDELGALRIRKELLDAVNGLKVNAPGAAGISPRVWKTICGDAATLELFHAVVQQFWQCERPPEEWDVGLLRILPKKGDLSRAGNHRGINLLEAAYKVVASILRIRLTQSVREP